HRKSSLGPLHFAQQEGGRVNLWTEKETIMNSRPAPFKDTRGSILVVTAMLATIMAVSIASFIKLGNHESRLANMSFYLNNSLNLAEGGVEQALYALNHDDWSG